MPKGVPDKQRKLAWGYQIKYFDGPHSYYIKGKRKVSVTTITGMVDGGKSGALQWWAVKVVLDKLKGELMEHAVENEARIDMSAREVWELIETCRSAYTEKTEDAADVGSIVHAWIEEHVNHKLGRGAEPDEPNEIMRKGVRSGIRAFLRWEKQHKVEYLDSERLVASRQHNYVGTLDILARVDGHVTVVDLKTSNSLYRSMDYQTAGYLLAHNEEVGEGSPLFATHRIILQLHKQLGTFFDKILGDDAAGDTRAFLAALTLYREDKNGK